MPIADTALSLAPALPWLVPFLTLPHLLRRSPDLDDAPVAAAPLVSIVVPARNESATIDTLLGSLRASTYPLFEVLVVNDQSTDDTAQRVARHAAADHRIHLLEGTALPEGWFGKPWACLQGYRSARGEYILFTDADTTHAPDLLGRAVGALQTDQADLLTLLGAQRCETFWERVIQPLMFFFLGLRFYPEKVNRATKPRDVIANGQFILVTREAYEQVGTHEVVRREVAEDLMLAQAFFRAGRRVRLWYAEHHLETRMYHDLRGLVEGWSKNVLVGGRKSWPDEPVLRALTPVVLLLTPLLTMLPAVAVPLMLLGVPGPFSAAVLALAAGLLFWALVFHHLDIPWWYALFYPLGAAVLFYVFLRSVLRGGRRIEWRGRTYSEAGQRAG